VATKFIVGKIFIFCFAKCTNKIHKNLVKDKVYLSQISSCFIIMKYFLPYTFRIALADFTKYEKLARNLAWVAKAAEPPDAQQRPYSNCRERRGSRSQTSAMLCWSLLELQELLYLLPLYQPLNQLKLPRCDLPALELAQFVRVCKLLQFLEDHIYIYLSLKFKCFKIKAGVKKKSASDGKSYEPPN
jgi:hypothetical protein